MCVRSVWVVRVVRVVRMVGVRRVWVVWVVRVVRMVGVRRVWVVRVVRVVRMVAMRAMAMGAVAMGTVPVAVELPAPLLVRGGNMGVCAESEVAACWRIPPPRLVILVPFDDLMVLRCRDVGQNRVGQRKCHQLVQ